MPNIASVDTAQQTAVVAQQPESDQYSAETRTSIGALCVH